MYGTEYVRRVDAAAAAVVAFAATKLKTQYKYEKYEKNKIRD